MAKQERADPPMVLNHDVLMIIDNLDRAIREMDRSNSANRSGMNEHDKTRLRSYTTSINALVLWIQAQPHLDLPETHPRKFPIEPAVEVENRESEAINHVIRLLEAARTEVIHSQSASDASRLLPFDELRLRAIVNKIDAFLDDYVDTSTPLDWPESSPEAVPVTHGN